MKATLLHDEWQVRAKPDNSFEAITKVIPYEDVTLPHDAVILGTRGAEHDASVGYFPAGQWEYRRTITRDAADAVVLLDFEGVYRDARVYLDDMLIGEHAYGYTGFLVDLGRYCTPGRDHELVVEARCGLDSRWYSGCGIYRPVRLLTAGEVYLAPHSLRVHTREIAADNALIEANIEVSNLSHTMRTVELRLVVTGPDGAEVASSSTPVTVLPGEPARSRSLLVIDTPELWSAENPKLYQVTATLHDGEEQIDHDASRFGVRTIRVDAKRGLQINGETVNLRGACIHHDNGLLGSASYAAAEERRVIGLKNAGFNAIRSAHHPMSVALLEACDRHGMYVLDETFDMWTSGKTINDYSTRYLQNWEQDVTAMVTKDYNHPSVVMYSIGNEIPETGSQWGAILGRRQAETIRSLDESRPTTNAINAMLSVMAEMREMAAGMGVPDLSDGAGINTMMSLMGDMVNIIGTSDVVTEKIAESWALVDVAGMNYLEARYEMDGELFPNRVILGTETFPDRIANNWRLVTSLSHVIGDFTWTGWDYLGEVGIGRVQEIAPGESVSLQGPYPWVAAWCADIDILGNRRPVSFYREIVFGLRSEPYAIAMPPRPEGLTNLSTPWAWTDGLPSWNWPGHENEPMLIEVYSDAEQVELLLNDERVAVVDTGAAREFKGSTTLPYQTGTLLARALRDGKPAETFTLHTSQGGSTQTELTATEINSAVDDVHLAFVHIGLNDGAGVDIHDSDRSVNVEIEGDGQLLAVGSAKPNPEVFLSEGHTTTFRGRALAIVRVNAGGTATLRVNAEGCAPTSITVGRSGA